MLSQIEKPKLSNRTICFINPPYKQFAESLDAPFNLMYLAAVAEEVGWKASIIDMKGFEDKIPEADIYGITATSPQWFDALILGDLLKINFPDSIQVIGGPHISAVPDLNLTHFNLAILGQGEEALKYLLRDFSLYKNKLNWIIDGNALRTSYKNLDEIPFPARHLVDWSRYKRGIYQGKERLADAVSIITSRGCPYNCVFCGSHVVFGHQVRYRSAENVKAEMRKVILDMGYKGFNFHDDTFCLDAMRVQDLCNRMIELYVEGGGRPIYWRCLTRANTIDPKLLECMRVSGCREIILGVESGSQKILDLLRKGVTVEQNLKAMQMIKKSGIQLKTGIIVGSPGESWETVKETEKLLRKCPPDFWNVSVFTPFPGSYAWSHPEKLGLKILSRNLREYAMVGRQFKGNVVCETEEMNKQDIEQARDRLIDLLLDIAGENYE